MERVNVIKFNFYVPMYGTGCFVCEKNISQDAKIISFGKFPKVRVIL